MIKSHADGMLKSNHKLDLGENPYPSQKDHDYGSRLDWIAKKNKNHKISST